jgi:hypothetical protein
MFFCGNKYTFIYLLFVYLFIKQMKEKALKMCLTAAAALGATIVEE